jgi:hypothetical protein
MGAAWARALNSHQRIRGAEAPAGIGVCAGASALQQLTPDSCEVEATAEFMTVRLAELVNARMARSERDGLSHGAPLLVLATLGIARRVAAKSD